MIDAINALVPWLPVFFFAEIHRQTTHTDMHTPTRRLVLCKNKILFGTRFYNLNLSFSNVS